MFWNCHDIYSDYKYHDSKRDNSGNRSEILSIIFLFLCLVEIL